MTLEWIILACVLITGAICAYTLHKARRVHLATFELKVQLKKELIALHQQLGALARLESDLQLRAPLPVSRGWAAGPDFLQLLADHARAAQPATVVECGSGTSTVVLARCMQINGKGHVYSLEHDVDFAGQTRETLKRHGLSEWATVLDAPLREYRDNGEKWLWYTLASMPADSIDMLVVDGPPEGTAVRARYPAGPLLFARLAAAATVFLDDADRSDEQRAVAMWLAANPAFKRRHHRTETGCVVLSTAPPS